MPNIVPTGVSPIAAAIAPQKAESVRRAVEAMARRIDATKAALEAAGMNIDVVAPQPHGRMSRADYRQAQRRLDFVCRLVTQPATRRASEPRIALGFNQASIDRLLADVADLAGAEFDAYVGKLEAKVGECDTASIEGWLWNYSILTVRKGDQVERWKTQQIVNVSVLGKLFNQWPTRKIN